MCKCLEICVYLNTFVDMLLHLQICQGFCLKEVGDMGISQYICGYVSYIYRYVKDFV